MISNKIDNSLVGNVQIPGDKSISHRSIIIPSISNGICKISNLLESEDVLCTINAFKEMGVKIEKNSDNVIIYGNGLKSLKKPNKDLYMGNSGTSARLLTGLLSTQNFETTITGDKSLSSRPMKRIASPLIAMNANIRTNNGYLPLTISGKNLNNKTIDIEIPSAQIKSGVILAAINTKGITKVVEHNTTRDHTEIMLEAFNANIKINYNDNKKIIEIDGEKELTSRDITVPSDLSSSAFFIVSAILHKDSKILLKNININPTRDGILIALKKMGAEISFTNKRKINNEEVCDIEVLGSELNGCELDADIAKLMIDEYPILSVAAAFAKTPSVFRGLSELRVKESDRLELIRANLQKCGVNCEIKNDDLYIFPNTEFNKNVENIQTNYDHRIAMAFAVMGSKIGPIKIDDSDCIKTSFPSFIQEFNKLGGNIVWKK